MVSYGGVFDKEALENRLVVLEEDVSNPDLWNDQDRARKLLKEREVIIDTLNEVKALEIEVKELKDLLEMALLEIDQGNQGGQQDQSILEEVFMNLEKAKKDADQIYVKSLLKNPEDQNNAFLEINAGAGGTEAQDWAEMLFRMYTRFANKQGYQVELLSENAGEEAGIKSVALKIIGSKAYGWLKKEAGVHRLVRISPYDANAKRHTSFASVWVYPEVEDTIDIVIEEKDLRIDTYRASGAGGQHVNKTESAIRITHLPTGVVVQCQTDRSQHRNREIAMKMLRARLYELELRKKQDALTQKEAGKKEIGWGSQIRSYVLQPYQLVKDVRTGVEHTNPQAVLDGDIDIFLEAALVADFEAVSS